MSFKVYVFDGENSDSLTNEEFANLCNVPLSNFGNGSFDPEETDLWDVAIHGLLEQERQVEKNIGFALSKSEWNENAVFQTIEEVNAFISGWNQHVGAMRWDEDYSVFAIHDGSQTAFDLDYFNVQVNNLAE